MILYSKVHSNDPDRDCECEYASIDISMLVAKNILKRAKAIKQASLNMDDLDQVHFFSGAASYFSYSDFAVEEHQDLHIELEGNYIEDASEHDLDLSDVTPTRTDGERLCLHWDSSEKVITHVSWEACPKYMESVTVSTNRIHIDVIKRIAGYAYPIRPEKGEPDDG